MASTGGTSRIVERVEAAMRTVVPWQGLWFVIEPPVDAHGTRTVKCVHRLLAPPSPLSGVRKPAADLLNRPVGWVSTTDRSCRPHSAAPNFPVWVGNRTPLSAVAVLTGERGCEPVCSALHGWHGIRRRPLTFPELTARAEGLCLHRWIPHGNRLPQPPDAIEKHTQDPCGWWLTEWGYEYCCVAIMFMQQPRRLAENHQKCVEPARIMEAPYMVGRHNSSLSFGDTCKRIMLGKPLTGE